MRPVVILMTSRTGSSLVAGIFAKHGLWHGPTYTTHPPFGEPYKTFEVADLKPWLRSNYGLNGCEFVPDDRADEFRSVVDGVMPSDQRWMAKLGVMFWPLFRQFKPHVVVVKRDLCASVDAAMARAKDNDRGKAEKAISRRYELMDEVIAETGGSVVVTDELIAGDITGISAALRQCGIEPDETIIKQAVDPKKWHFKARK